MECCKPFMEEKMIDEVYIRQKGRTVIKGNGRKFEISGVDPSQITFFQVDGRNGMMGENVTACDFGALIGSDKIILLEFKGGNVNQALVQLDAAVRFVKTKTQELKCEGKVVHCFIVCSKVPSKFHNEKAKFTRNHNIPLSVKSGESLVVSMAQIGKRDA